MNSFKSITNAIDTDAAHCSNMGASSNLPDPPVCYSSPQTKSCCWSFIHSSTLSDTLIVSSSPSLSCPDTPTKMSKAVHKYFSEAKSQSTAKAWAANEQKWSRVQNRFGKILTEHKAMKHLKAEKVATKSKESRVKKKIQDQNH